MIAITLLLAGLALAEIPAAETARIEGLIKHVAELEDAKFVRNGQAYDAATAAKFLRGKWEANAGEVASAEEFIDKLATKSSTTGKAYSIRFADGKEVPSGKYLHEQLSKHSPK